MKGDKSNLKQTQHFKKDPELWRQGQEREVGTKTDYTVAGNVWTMKLSMPGKNSQGM